MLNYSYWLECYLNNTIILIVTNYSIQNIEIYNIIQYWILRNPFKKLVNKT